MKQETPKNTESYHGYKIGDNVYVKPTDCNVLKGKVIGFQGVALHFPIVECQHPFKEGKKITMPCSPDRISKSKTVKVLEWKLVTVNYTYNGK